MLPLFQLQLVGLFDLLVEYNIKSFHKEIYEKRICDRLLLSLRFRTDKELANDLERAAQMPRHH